MSAFNMGEKPCKDICVCAECELRMECAGCIDCDPDLEPQEETKDSYGATKECYNKKTIYCMTIRKRVGEI